MTADPTDPPNNIVTPFPNAGERLLDKFKKEAAPAVATMMRGMTATQDAVIEIIGFKTPPNRCVIDCLIVSRASHDPRRPAILRRHDAIVIAQLYEFCRDVREEIKVDWEPCLARLDNLIAEHDMLLAQYSDDDELRFTATISDLHDFYHVPLEARPAMEMALSLSLSREALLYRDNGWVRGQAYVLLLDAIHEFARPSTEAPANNKD